MKKLIVLGTIVLFGACTETPTAPEMDVSPQMAAGGADVWMDGGTNSYCYDYPGYYSYCNEWSYKVHQVNTPSGNTNYFYKEDGSWDYNDYYYGYSEVMEYDYDYSLHFKKGQLHVQSWSNTQTSTYTYGGTTYNCEWEYQYHFANGKVTKEIYGGGCVPA